MFFAGIAERAYLLCPGRSSDSGKCSNKLGKLCSLKVHGVLRCLAKWKLDKIKFVSEGRLRTSHKIRKYKVNFEMEMPV